MFTRLFWKDASERAIKTFAQTLVALIATAATTSIVAFNWPALLGIGATAAVVSILTSVASAGTSNNTVSPASAVKD